ncbi:hypothetical protein DSO57_1020351 [Entomophthora muscae]|uniref:Uncharacterized protein n=1 Tax=Entomophthora muscae TaxID=34485 RepID=A0ACC2U1U7_9FUNG|nr:hypothetical protein DSO57_1020351 [Entomophthora muscae]
MVKPICGSLQVVVEADKLVGDDPTRLLHLLDKIPGKATGPLFSGEILVKSLTSDNLGFYLPNPDLVSYTTEETPHATQPLLEEKLSASQGLPEAMECALICTPWLLTWSSIDGVKHLLPLKVFCVLLLTPLQSGYPSALLDGI